MISQAYITEWGAGARWADPIQVEQDLILTRLIIEIANHELLGSVLAFRGGTCLQKLHVPEPLRYSEDLDYVRTDDQARLAQIFDALRGIAAAIGLREHRRKFPSKHSDMAAIWFDADPENEGGRIRIKVESNVKETRPFRSHIHRPFTMESRWWSGETSVRTFELEELLGTKLRALYERRKGRDLFDLWAACTLLAVDDQFVVDAFAHYQSLLGKRPFTYPQLRINLRDKLADPLFTDDLDGLLIVPPEGYDTLVAANLIMERFGMLLRNAPEAHEELEA